VGRGRTAFPTMISSAMRAVAARQASLISRGTRIPPASRHYYFRLISNAVASRRRRNPSITLPFPLTTGGKYNWSTFGQIWPNL
ncbi:MAG: hypothetical protein ACTSU4_11845, partial [Promethearchaeota archaeon]